MTEFTLRFKPDNKALQFPDFEKNLALRLLDVLCGRDKQCIGGDPVPHTQAGGDMRMIGRHNDFWLKREDAATYRVISRYSDEHTKLIMAAAQICTTIQYEAMLLPETSVTKAPTPPKDPPPSSFPTGICGF